MSVKRKSNIIPAGFAGTGPNGSFFEAPAWVDQAKLPGMTSQLDVVTPPGWWIDNLTGKFLFFSPNLIWLLIALIDYFVFPYDYEAAKTLTDTNWIIVRLLVNTTITFGFAGFWHCVLYLLGWSERPFKANRKYNVNKVLHNMWYTFLGVLQYTVWEALYVHCCATEKISFVSDKQSFSNPWNMIKFVLTFFWVPLFREFHFYFAHRFIHIKSMYKYIHSLHHRNTDVEPFAGLSMHPIEHLYYFSCLGPSFIFKMTPFAFMWNGIHLLISPAAGHSGWEDHFQSDQYHYLHHRFFECNYGTSGTPFDKMFGTFRDKLKESGTSYKGGSEDLIDAKTAATHDAKATLKGLPDMGFSIYLAINSIFWAWLYFAYFNPGQTWSQPHLVSFLVSVGPIITAQLMANLTEKSKRSIWYPFHKDGWQTLSSHLLISSLLCIVPVYILVHMVLVQPGDSFYFWI